MARFSEAELGRLKEEISIERLVAARGVRLKKASDDNLLGRCPFHEDKTPSLVVSPRKGLWHCLGACQTGGDVIEWVMKAEGISFRHAVELLREGYVSGTSVLQVSTGAVKASTVRKLPPPVKPDAEDGELLRQVVAYYQERLKETPAALEYLQGRGLSHPELIDTFRLGFADRTLGLRLPMTNRKSGAEVRGRLQRLGVIRESGHEHFNGSVVIPILGEGGEVLGMYGRKVTANLRPGTPLHLYLPGPHRGVWNAAAVRSSKQVILCEALIDALTFWCAGFRNVTAAYGVEGFTDAHLTLFKESGIEEVLIAYDRDEAGEAAAEKLSKRLLGESIDCWRVQFPKGMDANDYALKVQPAQNALGVVLRHAQWMGTKARPLPLTLEAAVQVPALPLAASVPAAEKAKTVKTVERPKPAAAPPALPAARAPAAAAPSSPVVPVSVTAPAVPELPVRPEVSRAPEVPVEVKEEEVVLHLGDRRYRVRGLGKNSSYDALKVNVLVSRGEEGQAFHVDTLDVYAAKARAAYVKQAALELGLAEDVLRSDMGRLLLKLEELQEAHLKALLTPKTKEVSLSEAEREEALELLKSPRLLERILEDFARSGVVGEETNKLVGYLAAVSRKLDEPLAVVIQSSSAAGKSSLMEAVLALVPEEDRVKYSAMTGQSLFYMGDTNLKHRVLALVEEEGARSAAYALKLLQSEGELTIASTGKDPQTGRLITHEYRVEGPVMLFLTTTAIELDEELMNRCIVLSVDEDREQTRAIHRLQREKQTLEGLLLKKEKDGILRLHRNAQRLLRPLLVANPYAKALTFLDTRTRTRRDHMKYLTLIRSVALLHQYQREVKRVEHQGGTVEYIEATKEDIAVANRLAHAVLGRSLDELPPQTRRLLQALEAMVTKACEARGIDRGAFRFSRREVREETGWGDTQLKVHLGRLVELEYLVVHRTLRGAGYAYELVYDGKGVDGTPFLAGLIDIERLGHAYDVERSGAEASRSAPGRGAVGPQSAPGREVDEDESPRAGGALRASESLPAQNARLGCAVDAPSYGQAGA